MEAEAKNNIVKTRLYSFEPLKPHFFNSKTRVYSGIHYFSYFCSKHRLWVLVRTASEAVLQIPTIYVF